MPLKQYDKYFGGRGGAGKAHAAMVSEYGAKKGEQVFYATKNKKKSSGGSSHGECESCMGRTVQRHSPPEFPKQDDPMAKSHEQLMRDIDEGRASPKTLKEMRQQMAPVTTPTPKDRPAQGLYERVKKRMGY